MKNCISKGLCLFFILACLFLMLVPAVVFAQSGHGGTTEVIARVETQPIQTDTETQPLTTQPEPVDDHPIQTGEVVAWYAMVVLFVSGMLIIVFRLKDYSEKEGKK